MIKKETVLKCKLSHSLWVSPTVLDKVPELPLYLTWGPLAGRGSLVLPSDTWFSQPPSQFPGEPGSEQRMEGGRGLGPRCLCPTRVNNSINWAGVGD